MNEKKEKTADDILNEVFEKKKRKRKHPAQPLEVATTQLSRALKRSYDSPRKFLAGFLKKLCEGIEKGDIDLSPKNIEGGFDIAILPKTKEQDNQKD